MRERLLLWFGLLGPPAAWAIQHVTGYALTEASCTRGGVALDAWTIAVTAAAATVTVLAGLAAVAARRATQDADEPPGARIHFLASMGMVTTPLFLMIILMSGLGSLFLSGCVQS